MALFEVPGWSVKTAPIREDSHQVSKKRKRPSSDCHKLEAAGVNMEKLMSKLTQSQPEVSSAKAKGKAKRQDSGSKTAQKIPKKKQNQLSESDGAKRKTAHSVDPPQKEKSDPLPSPKPKKKAKTAHTPAADPTPSKRAATSEKQREASNCGLTTLQKNMKESLDGARFRLINENLYKSDSHKAHQMMHEDPKVFEEYHDGFRHQVLSWPTNPVEHYISTFSSYPQNTIIADLGCGDAALAKSLIPKGISVISFDLVSDNKFVVEADICDKIPLPGSEGSGTEKSAGEGQVVDVVVCALSLMGINWLQSLREAWRILKIGGELHIAEVTSRLTDTEQFQNLIGSIGFRLKAKDNSNSHFVLFEFVKVAHTSRTERDWAKLLSNGSILKPCEYKRR